MSIPFEKSGPCSMDLSVVDVMIDSQSFDRPAVPPVVEMGLDSGTRRLCWRRK